MRWLKILFITLLVIIVLLSVMMFIAIPRAHAATVTRDGSIFVDDASVGTAIWSTPGNAINANNIYASVLMTTFQQTHYLKATGFSFSIPSNATINGILVDAEEHSNGDVNGDRIITANRVRLVKNGIIGTTNRSGTNDFQVGSDAFSSYGGLNDLWGDAWTPADINASNFGVAIAARNNSEDYGDTAYIDYIRITISYSFMGPTGVNSNITQDGSTTCGGVGTICQWAWNDISKWWDFYSTQNVLVSDNGMTGYASSSVGPIVFDSGSCPGVTCLIPFGITNGSTPSGGDPTCVGSSANGKLSGYAWNDTIGWISFSCLNNDPLCTPAASPNYYQVSINPATGDFTGWAWNDVVGWISFNNSNHSGSVVYKVNTTWRPSAPAVGCLTSSIFDTQITSGTLLNSIIWQGNIGDGETCVDFQIATSSIAAPPGGWNFMGPNADPTQYFGASCDAGFKGGVGCATPNTAICIDPSMVINARYLRYKVRLKSNQTQTISPQINNIILDWSK